MEKREPIFQVPGVVMALLAIMVLVHSAQYLLPTEQSEELILALAFIPTRYAGFASELPGGNLASVTSFVTHMFVHGSNLHLMVNGAWLLAFGSILAKRIGAVRMLALFLACGIAGALMFLAVHPRLAAPVVGASGGIAGLMGAVMRFMFNALEHGQGWMLREAPAAIPRMSLAEALRDRRFVTSAAVFVGLNVLAIWGVGTPGAGGEIAWEAHLGGFFFALFAFALFDIAPQTEDHRPPIVE